MSSSSGIRFAWLGLFRRRATHPDETRVREAYDAHHASIRAYARRLIGDDDLADDLVQETFLAYPTAADRSPEVPVRALLFGICSNRAKHHVRTAARRRAAHTKFADLPPDERAPDAERAALRQELLRALDSLTVAHRTVLVLCDVEGFTSAEAALSLGIPEATVRTRLFHARKNVRAILGDAEGGDA